MHRSISDARRRETETDRTRTAAICIAAATIAALMAIATPSAAVHPLAAPGVTSLTNPEVRYTTPDKHFVILERGPVRAIIADNEAIDVPELPGHRAGYNGVASLVHTDRAENLFVPSVAGLNFEHIHDGTHAVDKERFEPRRSPMQLRVIDRHTVELHQPPTPNWRLESCGRYRLLEDGVIEYTFECIPRAKTFQQGYIGLFWASYIHQPEDKAIFFRGWEEPAGDRDRRNEDANRDPRGTPPAETRPETPSRWIRAESARHGVDSTHPPRRLPPGLAVDLRIPPDFSLTLVNHPSRLRYDAPSYFGVSHDMAYVQIFRARDAIWFAQSPSGGGEGNPAWDFQWFIPDYEVDQAYGFVMRAAYLPYENREQIEAATDRTRAAMAD